MTISDNTGVTSTENILPDKSRSLRQSSVARRLETETRRKGGQVTGPGGVKEKVSKTKRLSKYRRKTENAKERERMKKFNDAFENLRQKLPNRELLIENTLTGEKDTKVSALRSAIHYIKSLQSLVADCDAGNLDQEIYTKSAALDTAAINANKTKSDTKNAKTNKKSNNKKKLSPTKKVSTQPSDKWTNYSQTFLKQRFSSESSTSSSELNSSSSTASSQPQSPRDVNEISLHISLLDSVNTQQLQNNGQVFYILQLDDKIYRQ